MERLCLVLSTLCFLGGFGSAMYSLRAHVYRPSGWNFVAMMAGFVLQTAFLMIRGEADRRCPVTSLFETLIFLCWAMMIFYLVIGASYRLSLLGAFTSPLVFAIQAVALLLPAAPPTQSPFPANPWLELHAALSVLAYGAFALAGIAGAMYLAQERQLKTHHLRPTFYRFPPIRDLAVANRRLIFAGFGIFTVGLAAGFWQGAAHVALLRIIAVAVWLLYAAVIAATLWRRISPRRVAWLSLTAFSLMMAALWAIQFVPQRS